jgi:acyl-CoA thioester hydrolase
MKPDDAALAAIMADPRVIWSDDVIRYADIDANNHVNNTVFSVFCESGRVNLFRVKFGAGLRDTHYFVIAKLTIEYHGELRYPGTVRTGTWLTRLGRTSIGLGQVLLDGDGRLAATSDCVSVGMGVATRRPEPFGPELRHVAENMLRE